MWTLVDIKGCCHPKQLAGDHPEASALARRGGMLWITLTMPLTV
jgi:hypothetical protein